MSWRRSLVLVLLAVPLMLGAAWWWALHTTSGARFIAARVQQALGEQITLQTIGGSVAGGLEVEGFRYHGRGVTVEVAHFAGRVGLGIAPLSLRVDDARARSVNVVVRPDPASGPARSLEQRLARLVLPFGLHIGALDVLGLTVSPSESVQPLQFDRVMLAGHWTEQVDLERFTVLAGDRRLDGSATLLLQGSGPLAARLDLDSGAGLLPRIEQLEAAATVDGDLRGFDFTARGRVREHSFGELAVAGHGQGDFRGLTIAHGEADGPALAGSAAGELHWAGGFRTDLQVELARLDPGRLLADWPAGFPVAGRLRLLYDAPELAFEQAALAVTGTETRVTGEFRLHADTGLLSANLDWRNLRWPLDDAARLASESGHARLAGSLDDWHAAGSLAVAAPGLPPGRFSVDVRGDRDHAAGEITEGEVLGGRISGSASASWRGQRAFAADLFLAGVRPDALLPEWPGIVSGHVSASGQGDPLRFEARLDQVSGRLRGWPLQADGRIALRADGLAADNLVVRHGDSSIRLSGSMQSPGGVIFSAAIADLGNYVDDVGGDLQADGSLLRRDGEVVLQAGISSNRLAVAESEFTDTTVQLDATRGYQAVELHSQLDEQALFLSMEGAPDDPQAPAAWDGTLTGLSLSHEGADGPREIHLVESAGLRIAAGSLSLARACLQGSVEARLCVQLDWVMDSRLEIFAELDSIAVDRVNQFVDTGFRFDQLVTGHMRWDKDARHPLTAAAELTISAGSIQNAEREDLLVRTGEGRVSFEVRDGALLQGDLHLPLPGVGDVDGDFSIADIANFAASDITGHVDAELNDIGALRVLLPALDQADGRLLAKVDIGGSAGNPRLTGKVTLDGGVLEYRPIGLLLEDISLQAEFDEAQNFDLSGEFRAGEGVGTLQSSGNYRDGLRDDLHIDVQGRQLRVVDVPDLEATADADVVLGFENGVIRIDGSVLVPHARISPKSLPATRHSESPDVVVVAGELPVEVAEEQESFVVLDGKLEVGLGDDVVVDIDLAQASVTGDVAFEWDHNLVPVANGRYEIAGDVQAYGQVLTITEGTVRFSNVPANNPFLRIRAEREIFGNSQIKTAGILIGGTVRRPTVEPYTEPRTTRERALTLLVTGSDFDMEQGVGAIDFGTYIAPKLFVSYGIGLFDQQNVISARYDLGKGFGVKGTSGQKESGLDIIYHVER